MSTEVKEYLALPKIDRSEIQLLWHHDYWDGYLSGFCLYKDRMHFLKCVDEGETFYKDSDCDEVDEERSDPWYRRYTIIELTDEEIAEVTRCHELFRQHVGTHTDYCAESPQHRTIGATKPQSEWHLFYDVSKTWPKLAYNSRAPICWYEE